MTDSELALVLPVAGEMKALAEEVAAARGYAERSLSGAGPSVLG